VILARLAEPVSGPGGLRALQCTEESGIVRAGERSDRARFVTRRPSQNLIDGRPGSLANDVQQRHVGCGLKARQAGQLGVQWTVLRGLPSTQDGGRPRQGGGGNRTRFSPSDDPAVRLDSQDGVLALRNGFSHRVRFAVGDGQRAQTGGWFTCLRGDHGRETRPPQMGFSHVRLY